MYTYIHSYLNYANIAWASTYPTNLKQIHLKQKHAAHIVYNKDKFTNSKPLLKHLGFMHKFNSNETPKVFNNIIKRPEHRYPTNFSSLNFSLKSYILLK